jgi:hypothetical protein
VKLLYVNWARSRLFDLQPACRLSRQVLRNAPFETVLIVVADPIADLTLERISQLL